MPPSAFVRVPVSIRYRNRHPVVQPEQIVRNEKIPASRVGLTGILIYGWGKRSMLARLETVGTLPLGEFGVKEDQAAVAAFFDFADDGVN